MLQAASEFGINPHQVKVSSKQPEVDVFISKGLWDALSPEQQNYIRKRLNIFNETNSSRFTVDFYQEIQEILPGWPDPRINVPPGSITFNPDGTIIHQPFAQP
ncbi:MAG: hypothetical protein ACOYYF_07470 [Chloroflexota bacterium]|nr:hypothetical protein [Chloroflexota bacterium]MBI5704048.1 hypothetical protein [Chloroflexota bacterium]